MVFFCCFADRQHFHKPQRPTTQSMMSMWEMVYGGFSVRLYAAQLLHTSQKFLHSRHSPILPIVPSPPPPPTESLFPPLRSPPHFLHSETFFRGILLLLLLLIRCDGCHHSLFSIPCSSLRRHLISSLNCYGRTPFLVRRRRPIYPYFFQL